jgi:hypothetical protein
MVISLLWLPVNAQCNDRPEKNPALVLMHLYADEIKYEKAVIPYIVNIIAIYELSNKRHYQEVRNYIEWYLKHLNYPDRHGLTGTIYDYEISSSGEEVSTLGYDSVDGYAGTFLCLLNLYHLCTKDKSLISDYWEKIKDVAYLIHYLQREDGLTVALWQDNDHTKYLMDNCEAYAGIMSFRNLARRMGRKDDLFYVNTAGNIKKNVLKIMYNRERNNFYWAIDDKAMHASDWSVLYPDAIAQIFPIYFGLLDQDLKMKKMLWQNFNKRYKNKAKSFVLEQRIIYELTQKKMNK